MRAAMLIAAFLLAACPKNGATPATSGQQEAPAAKSLPKRMDEATRGFVDRLSARPLVHVTIANEGVAVVYDGWTVLEDGNFVAQASVLLGDEPFSCAESGRWSLDDGRANSAQAASVSVHITQTDCAGRKAPIDVRLLVEFDGDEATITHH